MGTLASAKREIKAIEMVQWYNKEGKDIPARLQGVREVIKATSYGFLVYSADGKESHLEATGKLTSYDGEYLCIHTPAKRPLTSKERMAAEHIREMRLAGATWRADKWAKDSGVGYMLGRKMNNMEYRPCEDCIIDYNIKGDVTLKYRVVKKGGDKSAFQERSCKSIQDKDTEGLKEHRRV